jgi:hypothetical protein
MSRRHDQQAEAHTGNPLDTLTGGARNGAVQICLLHR